MARNKKFESTATGREVSLIMSFAKDILDQLNDDWKLVDSFFGNPAALLHMPTNTTYHMDADATKRLDNRGYLKVVFAEQPNSVGSTYTLGSYYTFDVDSAVKHLKDNAKHMEKWLEKHPYESMKRGHLEQRVARLEKLLKRNEGSFIRRVDRNKPVKFNQADFENVDFITLYVDGDDVDSMETAGFGTMEVLKRLMIELQKYAHSNLEGLENTESPVWLELNDMDENTIFNVELPTIYTDSYGRLEVGSVPRRGINRVDKLCLDMFDKYVLL